MADPEKLDTPPATALKGENGLGEPASLADHARGRQFSLDAGDRAMVETDQGVLHRSLKGRHMQMIAM